MCVNVAMPHLCSLSFMVTTIWTMLVLYLTTAVDGYKPVIIIHGLLDFGPSMADLKRFITQSHPGTFVSVIDQFDSLSSLEPLWKQVHGFQKAINPIMQNAQDGIHLICFSQGGMICRGLLSVIPDHNVHSFISLSSPQGGQYGAASYFKDSFSEFARAQMYRLCYTHLGQQISVCNYWKDPHHLEQYVKSSDYLAVLNNEKPNAHKSAWKANFLRIQKLVLIGGPDDGVITPWQSSHFGFYDADESIVEMKDQDVYVNDVFGLKTLDERRDLVTCIMDGVQHREWHTNKTVYETCIDEWLV